MIRTRATRDASADKASGSKQTLRSLIRYWSPGNSPSTTRDELMNFRRDNIDPEILRTMLAHGFAKAPYRLLQGLSGLFSKRGLVRANTEIGYRDQAIRFRPRSLLISGSRDLQCPSEAVEETTRHLPGAREVRVMHCGTKYGHARESGHIDLVLGKNAQQEVWPQLFDWLMIP